MPFTKEILKAIYRKSSGKCHLCHRKLSSKNYNRRGARGAWHVDHSVPRSKGGTDHLNNLLAACIDCNCEKSNRTTRTCRKWNGKTRAPLSPEKRKATQLKHGVVGAFAGGIAGAAVGGPAGALIGVITGACLGSSANPDQ